MPNKWQEHLENVRKQNKDKSLKECMTIASGTYTDKKYVDIKKNKIKNSFEKRYGKDDKKEKSKKKAENCKECKLVLNDIIGFSKDLTKVYKEIDRYDIESLKEIAESIERMHKKFREESESASQSSSENSESSDSD